MRSLASPSRIKCVKSSEKRYIPMGIIGGPINMNCSASSVGRKKGLVSGSKEKCSTTLVVQRFGSYPSFSRSA